MLLSQESVPVPLIAAFPSWTFMQSAKTSLHHRQIPLALPIVQLQKNASVPGLSASAFADRIAELENGSLVASGLETMQINLGKVCNQTCNHCHVDAGPDRRESMSAKTAADVVDALQKHPFLTLDITGGAPEMNSNFRWLVEQARSLGLHVIDRCNLTILVTKGYETLAEFLAQQQVEIVASLPCYLETNCDQQRGEGVFQKSIRALQALNDLGYGKTDSGLKLNLVYNPVGLGLPGDQGKLEADYRQQLLSRFGVQFNRLFTITNMPISRFLDFLVSNDYHQSYMFRLVDSFNPQSLAELMCRRLISVDWQGFLYDCDFNQILDLPIEQNRTHLRQVDWSTISKRRISVANHCFGCTAGSGSSCQGALV